MMKKTWSETNNFEKTADFYFRWNCMFTFKSVWFKSLNAIRTFGDHPLRWRQFFFIFGTFISEPHKTNLFVNIFEQIWRKTVNAEMIFKLSFENPQSVNFQIVEDFSNTAWPKYYQASSPLVNRHLLFYRVLLRKLTRYNYAANRWFFPFPLSIKF